MSIRRATFPVVGALVVIAAGLLAPVSAQATEVGGVECTIVGTEGDDVLRGTPGDDVICGLGGDDVLIGRGGDDLLIGGPGDDRLRGGKDDDVLIGGAGDDELEGGRGTDLAYQGAPPGNGFEVVLLPKFVGLPRGTEVRFTFMQSGMACIDRAATNFSWRVGDEMDFHFLVEGSKEPACSGKETSGTWRAVVRKPDNQSWTAMMDVSVKFFAPSNPVPPKGTTSCAFVHDGLTCEGATTEQPWAPLVPLIVVISLGPAVG